MKTIPLLLLSLLLVAHTAFAATLEDVQVLDSTSAADGLRLKLQLKDGPKDSYFTVNVVRSDRQAFDKLALVLQKLKWGEDYRLTLEIKNFSPFPPGSYYRSESVTFSGKNLKE